MLKFAAMNELSIDSHSPHASRSRIQLLPEHLIDQIKAGEVIESPAALLKELLENALDAKSTEIKITVSNDLISSLQIIDNGCGIHPDDLPLVFARHATSKLYHFHDLLTLNSFGFRGEALASISSISHVLLQSQQKNFPKYTLEISYGEVIQHYQQETSNIAHHGTSLLIKDLFAKIPARLKFLQSQTAEKAKFLKIFHYYLLSYPEVKFHLHIDQELPQFWPAVPDLTTRLSSLWKIKATDLMSSKTEYQETKLSLFMAPAGQKSKKHRLQFIFVNRRPVQIPALHAILQNSATNYPAYCLWIELPSDQLDINVHPAKTEVKFFDRGLIFSLAHQAIKKCLVLSMPPNEAPEVKNPTAASKFPVPLTTNQSVSPDKNHFITSAIDKTSVHFIASSVSGIFFMQKNMQISAIINFKSWMLHLLAPFLVLPTSSGATSPFSSCESLPLIITIPIALKFDPPAVLLQFWHHLGLETEVSTHQILIVKSVPTSWSNLNLPLFFNYLFNSFFLNFKDDNLETHAAVMQHNAPIFHEESSPQKLSSNESSHRFISIWQHFIRTEMNNWDYPALFAAYQISPESIVPLHAEQPETSCSPWAIALAPDFFLTYFPRNLIDS